ncbi:hypothetical protein FNV43_RR21827 [Rhamnella rubrinervis]|uniref:Uncharacterized protein n=1 Tax=Rhamnella rubrinervis TaxID=2594499 RepID=A0A8K0GMK6_9ROSA|nr:hypothetical protein FNV43_RR21827 [Rhamnella rubrinervis]
MNTAEADDPGALAAVGCLLAISTILELVRRLPHLFVQVEPTLLPIMRRMLTTDGQGMCTTVFGFIHRNRREGERVVRKEEKCCWMIVRLAGLQPFNGAAEGDDHEVYWYWM